MKVSKIEVQMNMAEQMARLSPDEETKVGAILIKNDGETMLTQGYNGFVRGADDDVLPKTRPSKYEYLIHAEINLLSNAAYNGISTKDATIVCTLTPCKSCMRALYNAGIRKVIAKKLYSDYEHILSMKDLKVDCKIDEHGFYHLTYST
jgi:dCMP deaminase